MTCSRVGCKSEGTHHPALLLRPKGYPDAPPAEVILGILVCREHQESTTAADLITDEGWAQIEHGFGAVGRVLPDRATVGLAWKRPEMVEGAFGRRV